ncbi:Putative teichuronic acid biosynthesis glycosyltransferase TuaC [Paraconexibacter sp. AEG42_29]|uniref:Teichuronic acid biosynthesis glycosyltransferase TuaC n=1 Tax=Paraconexibacter sp. AEG42_29 TaxID=2997339 RepID=A0AAU7B219_9ACTN
MSNPYSPTPAAPRSADGPRLKVCIVAEFYPRADDPVLGIWAHRQAIAAQDAGAEVHVLVLYRPIPPLSTPRRELPAAARILLAQPRTTTLDGIPVTYVRFVSPPRPQTYGSWGRWAAWPLARALKRLRATGFAFDLIHAHNAVPAGEAVRRAGLADVPLVVSVHGGDIFHTAPHSPAGKAAVRATFARADLVLANSAGMARDARGLDAREARVVRLGTDMPAALESRPGDPTLVTVAHLVGRKRHQDVLRAMWALRKTMPKLRYVIVGDGPERGRLAALADELGLSDRVEFTGQLPHPEAVARARRAHLFVMPSVDEAFGVAYVEAMAAGVPVIGCLGEPGPQEIAAAGDGIVLVPPGDVEALADAIRTELEDPRELAVRSTRARETVSAHFTWERCGAQTVYAYGLAVRRHAGSTGA